MAHRIAKQPRRFGAGFITAVLGPVLIVALGLAISGGLALRSAAQQATADHEEITAALGH